MANKRKPYSAQFKAKVALAAIRGEKTVAECPSLYYQPKAPSDEELELLRLIDQQYLETPFYGICRLFK